MNASSAYLYCKVHPSLGFISLRKDAPPVLNLSHAVWKSESRTDDAKDTLFSSSGLLPQ